ncbi:MAG: EamA family transporter [Anaerotignum sp.]|nr:EamA family transporter [Anaerotignum sp.]MBQ3615652.1 EamA family transporter [Anaerotignum sp.]MBR2062188.1 EamA family transporter [Anaerotignum sp.]MBR2383338.1 EamA family transporter [Anaerotignum sp.]MBR3910012.1 EamA family transporter [Anaerotignum sp.]
MWQMLWPVLVVVGANTLYHTCAKSTPGDISPFASLALTYLIAGIVSVGMFFLTSGQKNILQEITKANWATYALSASIVFLEFGYICVYRAGWPVSIASLVCNLTVCCILLFVGMLLYKEAISARQLAGVIVCGIGLFLVSK